MNKRPTLRPPRKPLAAALAAVMLCTSLLPAPMAYAQQKETRFKGEPVTLNFVNAEIEGVSRAMGAILKQQFVVDPRVKGTITLFSEELPWLSDEDKEWIMGRAVCEWLGWTG